MIFKGHFSELTVYLISMCQDNNNKIDTSAVRKQNHTNQE